jgi:hypothetical protein
MKSENRNYLSMKAYLNYAAIDWVPTSLLE